MDISGDCIPTAEATEAGIRGAFESGSGFWEFVVLSRGSEEFLQAGHWFYLASNADPSNWYPAFEAATAGLPPSDDSREPDLYAVEFRDATGRFGTHQVFSRAQLLELFLAYFRGGEKWRAGLTWGPIIDD